MCKLYSFKGWFLCVFPLAGPGADLAGAGGDGGPISGRRRRLRATVSRSGRGPVPLSLSSVGRGRSFRACGGDGQTVPACRRRRSVPAWELGPLAILASCPAWASPGVVFLPGVRALAAADQLRRSGRRGRSAAGDPGRVRSWAASGGLRRQSWSRGRSGGS